MRPFPCLLTIALALSACAVPGEKDFLCGAEAGQPCQSLSDVDGSGMTGGTPVAERGEDSRADTLSQKPLGYGKAGQGALALTDGGAPYSSGQYRIPEKTGTLWIAPRRDDADLLHEATYVHFLIRPAQWGSK